jgi:hypothetical protein
MKYRLVMDSNYQKFIEKVNHAPADGWELEGFAVRTDYDGDAVYYQTFSKFED